MPSTARLVRPEIDTLVEHLFSAEFATARVTQADRYAGLSKRPQPGVVMTVGTAAFNALHFQEVGLRIHSQMIPEPQVRHGLLESFQQVSRLLVAVRGAID